MCIVLFIDNIPDPVLWIHTFTALFTNIQYSSPDPCKLIYKMVYLLNTQSGSRPEDSNIARIIKNNSDPVQLMCFPVQHRTFRIHVRESIICTPARTQSKSLSEASYKALVAIQITSNYVDSPVCAIQNP